MFELQRQSITAGQQLLERGLEAQQTAAEIVLRTGVATRRQGTELTQHLVDAQLGALESAFDVEALAIRPPVVQQFEAFERARSVAWDEFEDGLGTIVDGIADQQTALLAVAVESVLETHQEAERRTVGGLRWAEATTGTAQQQAEEAVQTGQEYTYEGFEPTQQTADEMAAAAANAIEEAVEQSSNVTRESLGSLEGISTTYVEDLTEAGIETVADLADAQIEVLAETAKISEDRAEEWIEAAQSRP